VTTLTADAVREVVLSHLEDGLARGGRDAASVSDDTDFFAEQLVDSFGLLALIVELEQRFGIALDFEAIDADDFTLVGPFCRYVEGLSAS
jgi:acyl carrier protein